MDLLTNPDMRKGQQYFNKDNEQGEEALFKIVSSSVVRKKREGSPSNQRPQPEPEPERSPFSGTSPDEALKVLKNQPDYENLMAVLRYLDCEGSSGFDIATPSPKAAQIARVLALDIVPNYWAVLNEGDDNEHHGTGRGNEKAKSGHGGGAGDARLLLAALQSITGINAVLLHLQALTNEARQGHKEKQRRHDIAINIHIMLEVLSRLLDGDERIRLLWQGTRRRLDDMKQRVIWRQFLSLIAGEKIVGVAAEAEDVGNSYARQGKEAGYWIASAKEYSGWKGRNLVSWMRSGMYEVDAKRLVDIFVKSGTGVHGGESVTWSAKAHDIDIQVTNAECQDVFTKYVLDEIVFRSRGNLDPFNKMLSKLSTFEFQKTLGMLLGMLADQHLNILGHDHVKQDQLVSASAGLLGDIVGEDEGRVEYLISWLTGNPGGGFGDSIAIRRAVVAVLSRRQENVTKTLELAMQQFGDSIYVRHAPILQQEGVFSLSHICHRFMNREAFILV